MAVNRFFYLSFGRLVIRELWKSKLRVKTLLILILGLAGTGFLLGPCLIEGAFVSVTGDTLFIVHSVSMSSIITGDSQMVCRRSINMETYSWKFGLVQRSVLRVFFGPFSFQHSGSLPIFTFIVLFNIFSGFVVLGRDSAATGYLALRQGCLPSSAVGHRMRFVSGGLIICCFFLCSLFW